MEAGVPKMHCAACVICDVKVSVDDENMERIWRISFLGQKRNANHGKENNFI